MEFLSPFRAPEAAETTIKISLVYPFNSSPKELVAEGSSAVAVS